MANIVNRQQLSKKYNVTVQTIKNWAMKGMPVHQESAGTNPALYDEAKVHEWYLDTQESTTDMAQAELRKKVADCTLAELRVAKASYKSIPISLCMSLYKEQVGNVSANLNALPASIAAKIPDISSFQERQDIVEAEITRCLAMLTISSRSLKDWQKIARDHDSDD